MLTSFEYNLSKDEYVQGLHAVAKSVVAEDPNRRWRIVEQVAFFLAVFLIVAYANPGSADAVLLTLVLTVVGGCFLQVRFAKAWRALTYDPARSDISLVIDERGVQSRQTGVERRYSWDALRRVHDLSQAVVLEFADWHAIPMPNELWSRADERSAFVEEIRRSATRLLLEIPVAQTFTSQKFLMLLASAAFGLGVMIEAQTRIERASLNNCSCALRRLVGPLLSVAPFIIYVAALAAAWLGLDLLRKRWPRLAAALAILMIATFVASQAIPPALQIYRFFSPPAT